MPIRSTVRTPSTTFQPATTPHAASSLRSGLSSHAAEHIHLGGKATVAVAQPVVPDSGRVRHGRVDRGCLRLLAGRGGSVCHGCTFCAAVGTVLDDSRLHRSWSTTPDW